MVMLFILTGCGNNSTEKNNGNEKNSSNDNKEIALYPVKDNESGKFG